uniref:Uncharacterized protein n=1 Tax=Arundo donax TaxID=35708 RepID=A0A0A9ES43_ARUDO
MTVILPAIPSCPGGNMSERIIRSHRSMLVKELGYRFLLDGS